MPGVRPEYRHVSDRTSLCPVMPAAGYRPAEPVEHQVAAFGTWRKLGYRVRAGEKGLRIFGPVTRRLRADEVASWLAQGRDPFDPDGRPRLVVRGFTVEHVFDLGQVDPGPNAQPLPDTAPGLRSGATARTGWG